jgi:hypothetical protein
MKDSRRSILIDARVNALPGAHGLARSVMKLVAHMREAEDGLALRVLVNPGHEQIFPLSGLPAHADVIGTDVTVFAQHRSWELARLIRAVDAAVLYIPYPTFTPLVRPCPFVVTVHDCTIESNVGFAGGHIRQALTRSVTAMALRRATVMTAPSRASLADIRRHYPAAPNPTLIPNALLPVILGALIRAIPDPGGLTGTSNGNAIQVLLILVMGACLIGVANAVRELVKERPIYNRERAAGLSPGAYLWSKLAVLGLISAVQAVVLVLIGLAGRPLPRHGAFLTAVPLAELMLGIAALAVASMTAGLLISAVVNSSDKTMPLLVVAVLAEVVLSGGVFRLNGKLGLEQLSSLSPSRWGFAAVASTSNLNQVTPPPPGNTPDPLWQHSARTWLLNMAMQVVLTAVLAGFAWWRLHQARPGRVS